MRTTRQKLQELADELRAAPPAEAFEGPGGRKRREIVELVQIAQGMGWDIFGLFMPHTDAEADEMVDGLIALLLFMRGDDLAPFDIDRHVRDSTVVADGPPAAETDAAA